jgi:enoyl-CoA hydratase/carnithine racemase
VTTFDSYRDRYENVAFTRGDDGVIEMRVHTDGGPLAWSAAAHRDLGPAFTDVAMDPENKVLVFSGTGDAFCDHIDHESFRELFEHGPGLPRSEGRRLLHAVVDVDIPVVGVVNGPATVHAELVVLSDIVIAADTACFADQAHFANPPGTAPGDGVHVVWPYLLGPNRGRHFLLTGDEIGAEEALRLGVVAEVVPAADALERGRAVARDLAARPLTVLHQTREILIAPFRALLNTTTLANGMARQGLSGTRL